nr:putative ribonuclease H-like domain-containing protein [Tanacetum cinerariifolium]
RKPALSFMRPFGCHVTILNTIDHLGKFDGKAYEGFFIGYSTNSKAFRAFNSRTRIVKENLHVKFSENTPNIVGSRPNWLFDIDALTKSMNYKPVVAENQSNGSAGKEEKKDAEDPRNEDNEVLSTEETSVNQEKDANVNSTKNINTVSPTANAADIEDNVVDENIVFQGLILCLQYLKGQPNLGLWYPKDSPFDLVAYTDSDYASASLDKKSTTGGCQFLGCRLISWQCKKQTVVANSTAEAEYIAASNCCGHVLWIQNQLLDYGYNFMQTKIHIDKESTICIVKNPVFLSKTKHIEIRHHFNKDSNEKKLIQMIKIHTDQNIADLLTKAFDVSRFQYLITSRKHALSFMRPFGCHVTILNTIDHLGKFDGKAYEGFFIGYSTNSKAFRAFNSRTRIVEENLHVKFSENTPNIAGSRPNWLFDIDALTKSMNYKPVVAENQSNGSAGKARVETIHDKDYIMLSLWTQDPLFSSSLKDSPGDGFKPSGKEEKKDVEDPRNEDNEVLSTEEPSVNQEKDANVNSTKNINTVSPTANATGIEDNAVDENIVLQGLILCLQYLKGQPNLGLWYPKDSPFDLVAYTDNDYASASLDKKSTTGGCQFFGCRLISWQCKKQTVVANSTAEAEYIAAFNCCGQVLWIQNQLLDYGYNFMQTKIHIDKESTICIVKNPVFLSKTKHIEIRHHFNKDSNEKKLIQMIKIHTDQNVADLLTKAFDVSRFQYLITNGMSKHNCIYVVPSHTKKVFGNMKRVGKGFSGWDTPLFPTMMMQAQEYMGEGSANPSDPPHTLTITQPSTSKPQKKQNPRKPRRQNTQETQPSGPTTNVEEEALNQENVSQHSNDPLLSGDDSIQLKELMEICTELMEICTKFQQRVIDLENIKTVQAQEISSLKKRVKRLEKKRRSETHRLKRLYKVGLSTRVESSTEEQSLGKEDTSKQGRNIVDIDADAETNLVNETAEDQGRFDDQEMFDTWVLDDEEVVVEKAVAVTLEALKTSKPKIRRIVVRDHKEPSESTTIPTSIADSTRPKDENLAWDNVQAMMDANYELATRLQEEEQGELTIEEKSRLFVELLDKRKKHFAKLRAEEQRRKPLTKAQKRNQMCVYLKNMAGFTHMVKDKAVLTQESSSKRAGDKLDQERSKKQKVEDNKEKKELKQCLETILDDGDDVTIDATLLSSKEDLEVLWSIVKARFEKVQPVDDMGCYLLHTLKTMFEHHVEDNNTTYYLLVEKMYLLTNYTLTQMWNDVRFQVDYEVEMAYDLLRLVRIRLREGYDNIKFRGGLLGYKDFIDADKDYYCCWSSLEKAKWRDFKFKDEEGVDCLSNEVIFEQLTLMGSTIASAIICLATNQKFNFSKYIFKSMVKHLDTGNKFLMYLRFVQVFLDKQVDVMSKHNCIYAVPSHTKKVFRNMKRVGKGFSGRDTPLFPTMMVQAQEYIENVSQHSNDPLLSGEDSIQLKELMEICTELMEICTKFQQRVIDLENIKTVQAQEISSLKKRVKRLEKKRRSETHRLKRLYKVGLSTRVESSTEEQSLGNEDTSKQGRNIVDIDADAETNLVNETAEDQGRFDDQEMFDTWVLDDEEIVVEKAVAHLKPLKLQRPRLEGLLKKAQQIEDENLAWDNVQAMMDADYELATRLQEEEQGELTIEEKSRLFVELLDKRKKHFAKLRAEEQRRKPLTKAQKRNQMCVYLKNMAGFTHNYLKNKSFDEVQKAFDKTMSWINSFVSMDSEVVKDKAVLTQESSSKRAGDKLDQERSKKQKNTTYYLLVEKMYLLINYTLTRMWNDVRFQVDYEVEMAYDHLRLVRIRLREGYVPE